MIYMFNPGLKLPKQEIISDHYQGILPDVLSVQNWLNKRVPGDRNALLKTLIQLNRVQCEPEVRVTLMSIMDKEIHKELDYLFKKTERVSFPLSEEYQSLIDIMQHLLLESSLAYQIVITDIVRDDNYINQYLGSLLPEALYKALFYLSRLLVERYEFYLAEPVYIWQELNQLYLLTERIGAQHEIMHSKNSIQHIYLKIVILRLLDPYRLMRLEARKIHLLLEKWVAHCDIIGFANREPEQHFVVDLLADKAPHCFDGRTDGIKNKLEYEGRIIDMEPLHIFIDEYLSKMEQDQHQQSSNYQSRIYYEMLQRIKNELKNFNDRSEERVLSGNEIKLVSGLRACHHFISHQKTFDPQREIHAWQEQKLQEVVQSQEQDNSEINLINLLEEEKLLNKKNPMGELQSVNPFMREVDIVGDEWEQIYRTSVVQAHLEESQDHLTQKMQEHNWKQRNESSHGMLLVSRNDIEMPIAVGMLVAYRLTVEKAYCLASVKWLRINPHKGMAIGVHLIAVQSRPIAVKGEEGVGAGGQYHRAFLIAENNTRDRNNHLHLIVPAGIYDIDSILKVWHKQKLNRVKIENILEATDSFERMAFKVIKNKK